MEVKPADVKKLREKTGAGMLDCKNALVKADGNAKKAEKILKELGLAAAAKRSGRPTNEGRVFCVTQKSGGGIMELACETDFVARNEKFIEFGENLLTDLVDQKITELNQGITDQVNSVIGVIKENISVKRWQIFECAANQAVFSYIHGEGGLGAVVKIASEKPADLNREEVKKMAVDLAMHATAFAPVYLSREKIEDSYLREQREIFARQTEGLDKPEKVIDGIIKGKINKHLAEICLLDQGFVRDEKQTVAKTVQDLSKEIGGKIEIIDFCYYKVGDSQD